eukprot:2085634-Rhodomonas_salina.1
MDTDGLGVVTMESFMNVMARERTRKLDGDELAETIWGLFDSRHTGIINISEFQVRPLLDPELGCGDRMAVGGLRREGSGGCAAGVVCVCVWEGVL